MATKKFTRLQLTKKSSLKAQEIAIVATALEKLIPELLDFSVITVSGRPDVQLNTCGQHACSGHTPRPPGGGDCPGHSTCDTEACTTHTCTAHDCDTNGCSAHACKTENFGCGAHTVGVLGARSTAGGRVGKLHAALGELPGEWMGISLTIS